MKQVIGWTAILSFAGAAIAAPAAHFDTEPDWSSWQLPTIPGIILTLVL